MLGSHANVLVRDVFVYYCASRGVYLYVDHKKSKAYTWEEDAKLKAQQQAAVPPKPKL